jgi:ketosteroid isomerase-like protein
VTEPKEVAVAFWERVQDRDWDGAGALLADDVEFLWPGTGERFVGRERVLAMNRAYPEGWEIQLQRVVVQDDLAVTEVRVPHPTLGLSYAVSFFEVRDGRITRAVEYWVDEQPAPDWRAPFRETR